MTGVKKNFSKSTLDKSHFITGRKKLIKRKEFEQYIAKSVEI